MRDRTEKFHVSANDVLVSFVKGGDMSPEDIFLWPDGFGCFRAEYRPDFLRDHNLGLISKGSEEWFTFERNASVSAADALSFNEQARKRRAL